MRFALLCIALLSCSHTPTLRAQHESLPERKDSGPKIAVADHITFDGEVDELRVAVFMMELEAHVKAGEKFVVVEMNTPGGSVGFGMVMSRAIEKSPVPVVCVVDGMAASMGLYILQSCDVRVMTGRSLLMGHRPSIAADGTGEGLREYASQLDKVSIAMAFHITAKTSLSSTEYLDKISRGDFWLTADEAKELKFVDLTVRSVDMVVEALKAP